MNTITSDSADRIIQNHAWFTMLPGFFPIPIFDIAAITGIQLDMLKQLCKLYDQKYDENKGKAVSTALVSSILGRIPGYIVGTSFKVFPIIGWLLGGVSLSVFAGASTLATGAVFKEHFEKGGTLNDLNPEHFKQFYKKQLEEGKKWIRNMFSVTEEEKNEEE